MKKELNLQPVRRRDRIDWNDFVKLGKKLIGKPYVFGAEIDLNDPNPDNIKALDCSEAIEWLYAQFGVEVPDGSYNQEKICKTVEPPLLVGDLGFKADPQTDVVHHVGVYIGNNQVLEAKGKAWGTVITPLNKYMASSHFFKWGRIKELDV